MRSSLSTIPYIKLLFASDDGIASPLMTTAGVKGAKGVKGVEQHAFDANDGNEWRDNVEGYDSVGGDVDGEGVEEEEEDWFVNGILMEVGNRAVYGIIWSYILGRYC